MDTVQVRMTNLFEQLGLDSSEQGVADFIRDNRLPPEVDLLEAPVWSDAQRQLLRELLDADARWAVIVDQLNESLHEPD